MNEEEFEAQTRTIEFAIEKSLNYNFINEDLHAITHQIRFLTKSVLLLARAVQERMYPGEY